MTIDHGMNIEEIEAFGNRLQQHVATRLRDIASEVESVVGQTSTAWVGPDAEKFRGWWPSKRSLLRATAEDIHGFGQSALNNAAEQRRASGEFGTGAGGGGGRVGIGRIPNLPGVGGRHHIGVWPGWPRWPIEAPSVGDIVDFVQARYGEIGTIVDVIGGIDDIDSISDFVKGFDGLLSKVGPLSAIGAISWGVDIAQFVESWDGRSGFDRGRDMFGLAIDAVGVGVPVVGASKTAWDVGTGIGEHIGERLDDRFDTSGAFVDAVIAREGKVPNYDGLSGFGNFVADGFQNIFSSKAWGW